MLDVWMLMESRLGIFKADCTCAQLTVERRAFRSIQTIAA